MQSGNSVISWNNEVSLTVGSDIEVYFLAKYNNIMYSIIDVMKAKAYCRTNYYSFARENGGSIFSTFKQAVSYGTYEPPPKNNNIVIISVLLCILIVLTTILIIISKTKTKIQQEQPLL